MKGAFIGLGILIIAIAIAFAVWSKVGSKPEIKLKGIVGSEKSNLLENEQIKKLLHSKYGITLEYSRAGSIEMVSDSVNSDIDFLWPSSQVALEIFKLKHASRLIKSELIFNSPIVLYSWEIVVNALINQGIVSKEKESYFVVDMPKMLQFIKEGKKWSEIGLPELYGKVSISTTDPTKSNSGNMYAGLIANILNGDVVNSDAELEKVLPVIKETFAKQGFMQNSSGFLFEQFLKTGVGQYPIIAGYESQIVEFSLLNKEFWPSVKNKIKILYPIPTVWSEHPLLVLNKRSAVLIDALKDPEIQKMAWEQHGFRTGLIGLQNDPKVLEVVGIPENITKIVPMPKASIMEEIINSIVNNN
jgi:hypothetical protein